MYEVFFFLNVRVCCRITSRAPQRSLLQQPQPYDRKRYKRTEMIYDMRVVWGSPLLLLLVYIYIFYLQFSRDPMFILSLQTLWPKMSHHLPVVRRVCFILVGPRRRTRTATISTSRAAGLRAAGWRGRGAYAAKRKQQLFCTRSYGKRGSSA